MSAFAALRKLPPGHVLTWEQGSIAVKRYWKLSYGQKISVRRESEIHELIRAQLLDATRLRLRSDVPLGAFLSGGVDSSAVVAAMAQQLSEPVKTFSIGFDVEKFDETSYAREVAQLFETDHHEFRIEPDAIDVLPRLVWHYGEPFADHSAIPSFYLAELTRRHVTVALNGDGGDENFAGYGRYVANARADRFSWVPRPASRLAASAFGALGDGPEPRSLRARFRRLFSAMAMTPSERYAMWVAYFNEEERRALYTPDFLASLSDRTAPRVIAQPYVDSDAVDRTERLLDVDVETYLPGDLLVKMDIATMAHSLEVRSPLLDHEFMEMAASLPASTKLDGATTKRVFKDSLRPWLPGHILDRRKMGFGVPIGEWLRGALADLPRAVLLDPRAIQRGIFREDRVKALIDDHVDGIRDNANKIWALLQLELWMQTFVDSTRSTPMTMPVVA
jgi:asparagine synthase (glutamine-hydrolysing)